MIIKAPRKSIVVMALKLSREGMVPSKPMKLDLPRAFLDQVELLLGRANETLLKIENGEIDSETTLPDLQQLFTTIRTGAGFWQYQKMQKSAALAEGEIRQCRDTGIVLGGRAIHNLRSCMSDMAACASCIKNVMDQVAGNNAAEVRRYA